MQEERFIREETSQPSDVNQIHIQHIVSKMDTLAGLAIKYGVEVPDIKRLNGLVTDHQMFALRSVRIPLPGRHPPSPSTAVNSSASNRLYDDAFDPFSSPKLRSPGLRVTPAMTSLHGFYGLAPPKSLVKESENPMPRESSLIPDLHLNRHRRAQSLAIENFSGNSELSDDVTIGIAGTSEAKKSGGMKAIRRRQKTETDSMLWSTSESENADSYYSSRTGMSAATVVDLVRINVLSSVRKSSSTSNLQELDSSSTMWPASLWHLKPDGLPKPMNTAWTNKAAID